MAHIGSAIQTILDHALPLQMVCGKEFRSTGGRDMHVASEHKAVRYGCPTCGKQFTRQASLNRHAANYCTSAAAAAAPPAANRQPT